MSKVIWELQSTGYGTIHNGLVGKWHCFSVVWDSSSIKKQDMDYKLTCKLPGIKSVLGNFKNTEDAKVYAQNTFEYWLKGLEE